MNILWFVITRLLVLPVTSHAGLPIETLLVKPLPRLGSGSFSKHRPP